MIFVPSSIAHQVMGNLLSKVHHTYSKGLPLVDCKEPNLRSLHILVGEHWLEIPPETYLLTNRKVGELCPIGIVSNTQDYWVLGNTFMQTYYTIFDASNSKLGLVP